VTQPGLGNPSFSRRIALGERAKIHTSERLRCPPLKDIGILLRDRMSEYFKLMDVPFTLKYINPSYLIHSAPATASDSLFTGIIGQMAASRMAMVPG